MSEKLTAVMATFKHNGEEFREPVLNPFSDDKLYAIQTVFGFICVVEASDEADAIAEVVEHPKHGQALRIPEDSLREYGQEIFRGDEVNGVIYEKGGWWLCDGTILDDPKADIQQVEMTGQGVYYDASEVRVIKLDPAKVRYHGTYEGVLLPNKGVLASNMRRWYEEATQEPDTCSKRQRREDQQYDSYAEMKGVIRNLFHRAEIEGWPSDKLSGQLCLLRASHAYKMCGKHYGDILVGFADGYQDQWEKRVLKPLWSPNTAVSPPIYISEHERQTSYYGLHSQKLHYAGRFYRTTSDVKQYDQGDTADWVIRSPDGLFYNRSAGLGDPSFGRLADTQCFYLGDMQERRDLAEGLTWVHLGELRRQVESLIETWPKIELARRVYESWSDEFKELWESPENVAEKHSGLPLSFSLRLTPAEIGNILNI